MRSHARGGHQTQCKYAYRSIYCCLFSLPVASGRIIGLLERIFVFIAVVNNEFPTIGFILAAKAFARSKELENRSFAEYVLVGTLVSTLIAILAGRLTLMLAQML